MPKQDPKDPSKENLSWKKKYDKAVKAKAEVWEEFIDKYGLKDMVAELDAAHIHYIDFKHDNVMKRVDGTYVLIDIGRSPAPASGMSLAQKGDTPVASEIPYLGEEIVQSIVEDLGGMGTGGAAYGAPGSAHCLGVRAGSSSWSAAMNQMTDDDVEEKERTGSVELWHNSLKRLGK